MKSVKNISAIQTSLEEVIKQAKNAIYDYANRYIDVLRGKYKIDTEHYVVGYENDVVVNNKLSVYDKNKGLWEYVYNLPIEKLVDVLAEIERIISQVKVYTIQVIGNGSINEHGLYQRERTAKYELEKMIDEICENLKFNGETPDVIKEYNRKCLFKGDTMQSVFGKDYIEYPTYAKISSENEHYILKVIEKEVV